MPRTQIYGGREADEYRSQRDLVNDIMADNEIVEGEQVAHLKKLLQTMYSNPTDATKAAVPAYMDQLKREGYSETRVLSIYIRASARVAIPDSRKIKR